MTKEKTREILENAINSVYPYTKNNIEKITIENGKVSFIDVKSSFESNLSSRHELKITSLKISIDEYGECNRKNNKFLKYNKHCCGESGFGYPGDVCHACDDYKIKINEKKNSDFIKPFNQIIQFCDIVENQLKGYM